MIAADSHAAGGEPPSCRHPSHGERRTWAVVLLSVVTMLLELGVGWMAGSMALLADGWHMAAHVGALGLAWFAYRYGRRGERLGRLAFGPAKVNALAGYTNALILGAAAALLIVESVQRLSEARAVRFDEALPVALLGLAVNVAGALLLAGSRHDHHDHNLRAIYLHVLADALTSILAIGALLGSARFGLRWLDPAAGLVGGAAIGAWALGLARRTAAELMDMTAEAAELRARVVAHLEADSDLTVREVRVWSLGGGAYGCTVRAAGRPWRPIAELRDRVGSVAAFRHLAVEVDAEDWSEGTPSRSPGRAGGAAG